VFSISILSSLTGVLFASVFSAPLCEGDSFSIFPKKLQPVAHFILNKQGNSSSSSHHSGGELA
jgi:hypothetical protein